MTSAAFMLKRTIVACVTVGAVASLPVAAQHAAAVPTLDGPTDAPAMVWTPQLAARFEGCAARVSGVASAFVVTREDGTVERLPFDLVWKWTHDHSGQSPRVWVRGQCR